MKQPVAEGTITREVPSGWGPFRFVATSRVWLGSAEGIGREILFPDCWGWTADEATAKAQKALDEWKRSHWKWRR